MFLYFYYEEGGSVCREEPVNIIIHPLPPVDQPADVVACNSFTLPALTNGSYNTRANGSGSTLNAGDVINTTRTLYIFNDDGTHFTANEFVDLLGKFKRVHVNE